MKNLTVLKIGGSIITDRSSPTPRALPDEIERIAGEIADTHQNLIVVHGAGSYGHQIASRLRLNERFDARGVVETHRSVKELNAMVVDALVSAGVAAVPVHPFSCALLDNGRIREMPVNHIMKMLECDMVPVLHGDVAMDTVQGAGILSGDQIVPYLATSLVADLIGVGSNTDGVLDDSGQTIGVITPGSFEDIRMHIGGSAHTDVTGGMLNKVQELLSIANSGGINSRIFNAQKPGSIRELLEGAETGTLIKKDK